MALKAIASIFKHHTPIKQYFKHIISVPACTILLFLSLLHGWSLI